MTENYAAYTLLELTPTRNLEDERVFDLNQEFTEKMVNALEAMPDRHRERLRIGSARRYSDEQRLLWERYQNGGPLAAKPGTSMHERGLAIDFYPVTGRSSDWMNYEYRTAINWLYVNGPKYGVKGLSVYRRGRKVQNPKDIVHFEMANPGPAPVELEPIKRKPWWKFW